MAAETAQLSEAPKRNRFFLFALIAVILALAGIFVYGLRWIFSLSGAAIGSVPFLLFDYAVGLTMIFLPCTLPLAFVVVPMSLGKSPGRGIGMALSFGLGVVITLSIYGLLIGALGQALGVGQIETAKNILYALAGALAFLFALGELGLLRFRAPSLNVQAPSFILRQKDFLRAGLFGLFLGNVGVGCPNPLFNAVIIPQIVALGSPVQGVVIMFVQALGRITPLLILAFLGILGVNATKFLVKHTDAVGYATGWATVFIGSFLLVLGLFGHDWWVISGQHTAFEMLTQENAITNLLGGKVGQLGHAHGLEGLKTKGLFGLPIAWGTPVLLALWIFPMFWYWWRKRDRMLGWFFVMFAMLLISIFGWALPHQFASHWSQEAHEMREEPSDFHVTLSTSPSYAEAGKPFELIVAAHDKDGKHLSDLEVSHERILHVILVSEDLEEFLHVHPEDFGNISQEAIQKGEFRIPLILNTPGRWRVLVDAFREGKEVFDFAWLSVSGPERPISIRKDLRKTRVFEEYEVELGVAPPEPVSGQEVELVYTIRKDGKTVVDTEPYLGADMHLAIMPVDLSVIAHTHGRKIIGGLQSVIPVARAHGVVGAIEARYVFPFAGLWKIYGQFQHQGKVITTEFMVEVLQGTAVGIMPHVDEHD